MKTEWLRPHALPALTKTSVHIWRAWLEIDPETEKRLAVTLSEAERARADRFILKRDRDSFIASHGILRDVLARYLGCDPSAIEYVFGPQGKPSVSSPGNLRPLRFNLSHSHGISVVAITRDREVGVDVEKIRPQIAGAEIAERYFSPEEVVELRNLPADQQAEGFFLCWTRKEAYVKALGGGLRFPLDGFSVSLAPGKPAQLYAEDAHRWSIQSFEPLELPGSKHVAAVVCEGTDWTAEYLEWTDLDEAAREGQRWREKL
jgi:4'-phosphopantetheinyl transferase